MFHERRRGGGALINHKIISNDDIREYVGPEFGLVVVHNCHSEHAGVQYVQNIFCFEQFVGRFESWALQSSLLH